MHDDLTIIPATETQGLGEFHFAHPPGTFALTPASRIALRAIFENARLLEGTGIDWGTGSGCLAIAAARIPSVQCVYGLDILPANVACAQGNAERNYVGDRTRFFVADSYSVLEEGARDKLQALAGRVSFVLANPPSSEGDDGFAFRRRVLAEAREWLKPGGAVFLNISSQYGRKRVDGLQENAPGLAHGGVLASTEPVPFDLARPDLLDCLHRYVEEEARGGVPYEFTGTLHRAELTDATTALAQFRQTGESPLTRWQVHLFRFG